MSQRERGIAIRDFLARARSYLREHGANLPRGEPLGEAFISWLEGFARGEIGPPAPPRLEDQIRRLVEVHGCESVRAVLKDVDDERISSPSRNSSRPSGAGVSHVDLLAHDKSEGPTYDGLYSGEWSRLRKRRAEMTIQFETELEALRSETQRNHMRNDPYRDNWPAYIARGFQIEHRAQYRIAQLCLMYASYTIGRERENYLARALRRQYMQARAHERMWDELSFLIDWGHARIEREASEKTREYLRDKIERENPEDFP